ncbi:helix-turn-helix domain-containing protein [Paenibacillus elgii]|uniref:helix-turn-helix domain-containing protein n=1 Tax=Paenibacillus elgii TaxID=189691 RepID=UPI0020416D83|nr:helix-turn-helix transcriptional regulator [Paenibacillus elgii]MCM3269329.1 helix-turn-helix transcriptional regulator [Paenibacillus elgii]
MRRVRLKIKEIMEQRGLTQIQLSELSGVRQSAISEMSRNVREQISLIHLAKLADALNIDDINEFLVIEKDGNQSD